MPEPDNISLKYWNGIHAILKHASSTLPGGDDPRSISWSDPDDEWKNDAELQAKEEECWSDTDALISAFCTKERWPRRSKSSARFFAHERIAWAIRFIYVLGLPRSKTNTAAIPRPTESGWEFLEWLLIDAYAGRNPPRPKSTAHIMTFPLNSEAETFTYDA